MDRSQRLVAVGRLGRRRIRPPDIRCSLIVENMTEENAVGRPPARRETFGLEEKREGVLPPPLPDEESRKIEQRNRVLRVVGSGRTESAPGFVEMAVGLQDQAVVVEELGGRLPVLHGGLILLQGFRDLTGPRIGQARNRTEMRRPE